MSTDSRVLVRLAGCLCLAAVAGCGGKNFTPPPAADPAVARSSLEKALDCWKLRIEPNELQKSEPPVTMQDEDWLDGRRLIDFQILSGEQALGNSIRWPVRLKVVGADNRERSLEVIYVVSTNPVIHIYRRETD